ncbi:hypothetical protein ACKA01_06270 [Helcococcus kunzii]|uniref:Uncharacterized protein n=1 Tax=Helcococcus kunzii ATCC 51366 TaxID=883114 RepID=H3NM66_9FIRM|nr:hypothetical protein [Helcococcus kunzii]EHR35475.1 hypothetical protein HMPREF9709_00427 [Helcococcus kunzii ATCC 51366]QUY64381.1 hypothetical protein GUI37_02150 [Helcococcus kunzii]
MNYTNKSLDKNSGSATIEASLVFIVFVVGYLVLHSLSINLLVESITRKALFETGMDISSYIQFIDSFEKIDNIKTESINYEDYKDIIIENINNENKLIKDLIKLAKKDISNETKRVTYSNITKKILEKKMDSIKNDVNFENLGIVNGKSGIKVSDINVLENSNALEIAINYTFNLDKFGMFSLKNNVKQCINIGTWARKGGNGNDANSTIWNESNFIRGRYFADHLRKEHPGIVIKKGSGVDLFDVENNTIIQVYSLNIFNKTYSEKKEEKHFLKEEFFKTVKSYYKKLLLNIKNMNNNFISNDGKSYEISNPKEKLVIVLPEEAKELFDLKNIKKEIGNVEFLYMEKALNDN